MKKITGIIIIILINKTFCFSQIAINEIMYAPSDATNEWFELLNTGTSSVNLLNWKWKDGTSTIRTITSQNIILESNSFLIICEDSVKLKNQFPGMTGRHLQTLWNTLNNTGDNVILIDPSNVRIDSVAYQTSWGGNTGGYSVEKINSTGASNNSSNWGTSIDIQKATPGKTNSITPKPFDLALRSFLLTPLFPSEGETLNMELVIRNSGINNADNFSVNIYKDINFDSIPESNEILNSRTYPSLGPSDSLQFNYSIQRIDTGLKQYIAKIIYTQDDDTLNNKIIKRTYVSSQSSGGGGIVINEIMYDPLSNQSEWIELFNASGQSVNMKGWKYKEASSSVTLSSIDLMLNPGDYFVLAHDSTLYTSFDYLRTPSAEQKIKLSTGINLNNTGENISVTDSLNNIVDAVYYSPNWNNPNITDPKGISLERINPDFGSNDKNNWSSCANASGGTPGLHNSIFTKNISSNSTVSINPNPFSPDGDGQEDFTLIKYRLNIVFAQMKVKVYDIKGRLVRTLANNQVTGSEGTIIFNGLGNDNQNLRIGIYVLIIEAIDDNGGTVDIIKAPLVIAAKL